MNQNQTFEQWRKDPRLKNISPERLRLLSEMAEQLKQAPQNQKMAVFMSIQQKAKTSGVMFTDAERDLMVSVLTENMTQEERAKVQMIQKLASRMKKNGK